MKTQNELNAFKKEFEELNAKLRELTEEELEQICGGGNSDTLTYYVQIEICIMEGNDKLAKSYYKLYYKWLSEQEIQIIRWDFFDTFGYSIDS